MSEVVFALMDGLNLLVALALTVAAVVTAVRCGQKKLSPMAAWILAAGFALGLVVDLGYTVTNHLPPALVAFTVKRVLYLLLSLAGLLGLAVVALGLGLFSTRTAAAQEAPHG